MTGPRNEDDDFWGLGVNLRWREWLILLIGFGLILGVLWMNYDSVDYGGGGLCKITTARMELPGARAL